MILHKKNENNDSYWHNEAVTFSTFYNTKKLFSAKTFVSRFLDARTIKLKQMVDIKSDQSLLDVGCGNGVHLKLFNPCCSYAAGLDYSSAMIEQARILTGRNDDDTFSLKVGDAHSLPYSSQSFDWIISLGLLDYVTSIETVFREFSRVIKRPGTIVFSIPKVPTPFFLLRTSPGNIIRRILFDLPPIRNRMWKSQVIQLCATHNFKIECITSVWTAMWIVKIRAI